MGSAKYIGRVGALAVALGVGAAVATGQGVGVARADEDSSSADSPDTTSAVQSDELSPPTPSSGVPTPPATNGDSEPQPNVPEMNFNATGGAQTSGDSEDVEPAEVEVAPSPAPTPTETAAPAPAATSDPPAPPEDSVPQYNSAAAVSGPPSPPPDDAVLTEPVGVLGTVDAVDQDSLNRLRGPAQARRFTALVGEESALAGQQSFMATSTLDESALSMAQEPSVAAPDPVGALMAIPVTMVNLAAGLVAAVLSPFLAPGPAAPAQPPLLLFAVLDLIRREIARTFFNRSPNAVNDAYTTSEDIALTGNVITNPTGSDTDADGDPLTAVAETKATTNGGTVTINTNGSFAYTPAANYNGPDSFTYTVTDETGRPHVHGLFGLLTNSRHTDTGTVSITVTPVNDPPVAINDVYVVVGNSSLTGNVLTNDTDIDSTTRTATVLGTGTANGTLILNSNGGFTYTPRANFTGADGFSYVVSDGSGGTDLGTVSITVTPPPNAAPIAVDDTAITTEDTAVSGNVLANDTDGNRDPLAVSLGTQPVNGSVTLSATGAYTYTPKANFNGIDSFTYRVTDTAGASDTATVTITVNAVNDAPELTGETRAVDLTTGVITGSIQFGDPEGDTLTYSGTTDTGKAHVTVNPDGTYTYIPTAAARHAAAADGADPATRRDSFVITVDDGHGGIQTHNVRVGIIAHNSGPTQTGQEIETDSATGVVTGSVTFTDTDSDTLTYSGTTDTNKGHVTVNPDGTFTYTPTDTARHAAAAATADDADKQDTFTILVSDGHNAGSLTTVTITVTVVPTNTAPEDLGETLDSNPSTGVVTGSVIFRDSDDDRLTYSGTTDTGKGHVTVNPDGTFTYTPTDAARHAAAATTATTVDKRDTFTITVDDGHGGIQTHTVRVRIFPANAQPTQTGQEIETDSATGVVTGSVTFSDSDDDALSYSGTTDTAKGHVTVNPDGTFTYTPTDAARHAAAATNATADKQDTFTIYVDDGHNEGNPATATITVEISPANAAPTAGTVGAPDEFTGVVTGKVARDDDGDTMTYTLGTGPTKGTVDFAVDANGVRTGVFTYTPTDAARHAAASETATAADKVDSFTVDVDDGHGGVVTQTVTVAIGPANTAPVIRGRGMNTPSPTTGVTGGSANASDPDGDAITYTVTSAPTKGTVTVSNSGTIIYRPSDEGRHAAAADTATAAEKEDSFTITVTDGHGGATSVTYTVEVVPANSAPQNIQTAVGTADSVTGTVIVTVSGQDSDGDSLTYTVTSGPAKGSTTAAGGTITYTPTTAARQAAAAVTATTADKQDSFTITVSDGHGGTVTRTVTVAISPLNSAPAGLQASVSTPGSGGLVTGTVTASDPDGDTVTYSVATSAAKGTVTITPGGAFTYTPTDQARHAAAATNASTATKQDTFVVSASDGRGGVSTTTVTVTVSPTNTAPVWSQTTVGTPSATTGAVTGLVRGTDADGDSMTYALTTGPALGDATVTSTGTYTYTPDFAARLGTVRTDSFTVTISDGHGGATLVTVSVPIDALNDTDPDRPRDPRDPRDRPAV